MTGHSISGNVYKRGFLSQSQHGPTAQPIRSLENSVVRPSPSCSLSVLPKPFNRGTEKSGASTTQHELKLWKKTAFEHIRRRTVVCVKQQGILRKRLRVNKSFSTTNRSQYPLPPTFLHPRTKILLVRLRSCLKKFTPDGAVWLAKQCLIFFLVLSCFCSDKRRRDEHCEGGSDAAEGVPLAWTLAPKNGGCCPHFRFPLLVVLPLTVSTCPPHFSLSGPGMVTLQSSDFETIECQKRWCHHNNLSSRGRLQNR